MKHRLLLFITTVLLALPCMAQHETLDLEPLRSDKGIEKKSGGFLGFLGKAMDWFTDYDTAYVEPNKYKFSMMLDDYTDFQYFNIRGDKPDRQKISFTPKPHNKLGVYFGWQIFFVGWAFDMNDLGKSKNKKDRGTDFNLSLYSAKIGVDLYYRRTSNDYNISKLKGFPSEVPRKFSSTFNGLRVDMKGLNLFYVLNNRRFSYPAAYSQSSNQRRSAGSFIVGASFTNHHLNFDYSKLPALISEYMKPEMKVTDINYKSYGVNFGYGYNWVFAYNFLANLSVSPELSYNSSKIKNVDSKNDLFENRLKVECILRASVVYNNSKWYAGAGFVGRTYDFSQRHFNLNNGYCTLQISFGFNFGLMQEFKAKKK